MARLDVTDTLSIAEDEIQESFIQASGPGGQNVNKVASAVQLRFDVLHSPSLTDEVRVRLMRLAGSRLTKDGILVITAREYRDQQRNRAAARERLFALIVNAATPPVPRRPTKPSRASKKRRLDTKNRHSRLKQARSRPPLD